MNKKHIAVLCGGQSLEHEVSVSSAANILRALNPEKFQVTVIGIDKQGAWHLLAPEALLAHQGLGQVTDITAIASHVPICLSDRQHFLPLQADLPPIDVVFPVLHGPNGEDGTIQGLLKLAKIPFVGSDVLGSALSMDKDVMKRVARDAGLPIVDFMVVHRHQRATLTFDDVVECLGLPFFVKPCNLGSSVGVRKVHDDSEFLPALEAAFQLDPKIIIEQGIQAREIECAVLGNDAPKASVLGEIIPQHEFYSYEAKYLDDQGAQLVIPAKLPPEVAVQVQDLAVQAFQALNCRGLARVDFFLDPELRIYFNELNTIPGFTSISMYPMLWQASGVDYPTLIESLIELAEQRF